LAGKAAKRLGIYAWEAVVPGFPPISVRQPVAYDIVDNPVTVCGIGTAFEGQFVARLFDSHGTQVAKVPVSAGGTGIWGNYEVRIPVQVPVTPQGRLEVLEISQADGSELHKVVVPITFGQALLSPYHGFAQYTVAGGDSLSSIAAKYYGDATKWPVIYEANRSQIQDPDRISVGQVLRIPQ
jgi:nucleoid-associated protein YgaU